MTNFNNLISQSGLPATGEEINQFEREFNIQLPGQYIDLLFTSNGVNISGCFPNPTRPAVDIDVYSFLASIDDIKNGFISFESINEQGIRYQYQEKIFRIGGTHNGHDIMMVWQDNMAGKVYISDLEEIVNGNQIPLHIVANSLIDFLIMLKKV